MLLRPGVPTESSEPVQEPPPLEQGNFRDQFVMLSW